ncbi:MAG: Gfo/Idh/MocA family protein [Cyclobacteriaceae bacterium]
MKKIKWGILGCGKIAGKFSSDLRLVDGAELFAVASTDAGRAANFAKQYGFLHSYNSYAVLCKSDVDVIYVATPHGFHYEHVMLCLRHGKSVLCEKAFALNLAQLTEMIQFSRDSSVFLMEAFWTRFLPQYSALLEIIRSGRIGEIKMVTADFGFKASEPPAPRLFDPLLGGGALLDIGIYPVFMAISLLGRPDEVSAVMAPYETGVDKQIVCGLRFKHGVLATLSASFCSDTPVEAVISGTDGRIRLTNRFHNSTSRIFVSSGDSREEEISVHREQGFGYQFEARHVQECLQNGLTESPLWSLDSSLLLMETLDRIRKSCGIRYSHIGE